MEYCSKRRYLKDIANEFIEEQVKEFYKQNESGSVSSQSMPLLENEEQGGT